MKVTVAKQDQAAAYVAVPDKLFMRVPGRPTRKDWDIIYEEACDVATSVNVGYDWARDFELLEILVGRNRYMGLTTKVYV